MHLSDSCRKRVLALSLLATTMVTASSADPFDSWAVRTSGTSATVNGVAYGNGTFVAVGSAGAVRTSPDGLTWTAQSSGLNVPLRAVTFAEGRFLAVGGTTISPSQVQNFVLASTNGVTWRALYSGVLPGRSIFPILYGVTSAKGMIVGVGGANYWTQPLVISSADETNWTAQYVNSVQEALYAVSYGQEKFCAVGHNGLIVCSTNGTTWEHLIAGGGDRTSITYGAGLLLTTAGSYIVPADTGGYIIAGSTEPLFGLTYAAEHFVAVGGNGAVLVGTADLQTWTDRPRCTSNTLNAVTYGRGTFLAVGTLGTIIQSADITQPWFSGIACSPQD